MFNLPKRKYCNGQKKLIAWRLPDTLLKELNKIAKEKQWALSETVQTALDQFVQHERRGKK